MKKVLIVLFISLYISGCLKKVILLPQILINNVVVVGYNDISFSITTLTKGGSDSVELGIEYSPDYNFISSNKIIGNSTLDSQVISISGLNTGNYYWVRAFIKNEVGISYSNYIHVRTANLNGTPSIVTNEVTSIDLYSAECKSTIFSTGNTSIINSGVCYSLTPNPDIADSVINTNYTMPGDFVSSLSNLIPGTTYYIRSFAMNNNGICYGNELNFTTLHPVLPDVSTNAVSSITFNSLVITGTTISNGTSPIINRGFCWSSMPNPTLSNFFSVNGNILGDFSANVTNLMPNTIYYLRSYATNNEGTTYGNQLTITTMPPPPVLVSTNNCNSMNGMYTLYYYWGGTNTDSTNWMVYNNGHIGSCIRADNPNVTGGRATGGYVEFQKYFSRDGFIKLWVNTPDPGYNNIMPQIYIDGISQATPLMTDGNLSSFYWMQIKTVDISAGLHTIKINWPRINRYAYFSVDEIEFWEYP